MRESLLECHKRLPKQPALALTLRVTRGGRDADALLARRAGMKTNTFLQNLTRARRLLLACLEKHGIYLAEEFC